VSQPSQKPNVVVVKVHRNQAGHTIPFDKLYFYRREDRDLIPKNFGYALVLPADDPSLSEEILKLKPKKLSHFKYRRDDAEMGKPLDLDGRKHSADYIAAWWRDNIVVPFDLWNRVLVIPILTAKVRKRLQPRYLSASRWFERQDPDAKTGRRRRSRRHLAMVPDGPVTATTGLKPSINEMAYLATPHAEPYDKVSPICQICPRMLLHLNGECLPGQKVCFKALDFALIDQPPKQAENSEEPAQSDPEDQGDVAGEGAV
jgi:hypothetical protein